MLDIQFKGLKNVGNIRSYKNHSKDSNGFEKSEGLEKWMGIHGIQLEGLKKLTILWIKFLEFKKWTILEKNAAWLNLYTFLSIKVTGFRKSRIIEI